jgi:putative ABC transport system permease protein
MVTAPRTPESLVGDSVRLQGAWRRVVGVRAAQPGDESIGAVVPLAIADASMAPHTGAGPARPRSLLAQAVRVEDAATLRARVESWLRSTRGAAWKERHDIRASGPERLADVQRGMLLFRMLMGAFTGISLVVGGIGIMNVLLASVAERTREIGLRKALGARARDILVQFLAESVAITGVGSALGALLGIAVAYAFTAVMRARTEAPVFASLSFSTVATAALSAVVVGLAFGTYPALRAARLSPIDAIHTE